MCSKNSETTKYSTLITSQPYHRSCTVIQPSLGSQLLECITVVLRHRSTCRNNCSVKLRRYTVMAANHWQQSLIKQNQIEPKLGSNRKSISIFRFKTALSLPRPPQPHHRFCNSVHNLTGHVRDKAYQNN